jgi:hypothetical protein
MTLGMAYIIQNEAILRKGMGIGTSSNVGLMTSPFLATKKFVFHFLSVRTGFFVKLLQEMQTSMVQILRKK